MATRRSRIKREEQPVLSLTVRHGRIERKPTTTTNARRAARAFPAKSQRLPKNVRVVRVPWRPSRRVKSGAITLPADHPKRLLPSLRQEAIEIEERMAGLESLSSECVDTKELAELRCRIKIVDQQIGNRFRKAAPARPDECHGDIEQHMQQGLAAEEYKRYGRQMIVPGFGLQGQLNLQNSSVLVVGLGGLGCPAAAYIVGAGIRDIGLMDGDDVEISNLHRQILHTTGKLGEKKVESAYRYLNDINPNVAITRYPYHITPENAVSHLRRYDLILDCTDTPASRYLISDASVLAGKPLISASALAQEGQLLVLNSPPAQRSTGVGGFCYRCVYPRPPPPDSVLTCGEGGILGPIVGTMGTMMATHAIDILKAQNRRQVIPQSFWIFNPFSPEPLRSVRIKGKRNDCIACSPSSTLTEADLLDGTMNYQVFCGIRQTLDGHRISPISRVSPIELTEAFKERDGRQRILIDVQEAEQHSIASLPMAIHFPFSEFKQISDLDTGLWSQQLCERIGILHYQLKRTDEAYFICRHGNDSERAVKLLQDLQVQWPEDYGSERCAVKDVRGGIEACRRDLGLSIPEY